MKFWIKQQPQSKKKSFKRLTFKINLIFKMGTCYCFKYKYFWMATWLFECVLLDKLFRICNLLNIFILKVRFLLKQNYAATLMKKQPQIVIQSLKHDSQWRKIKKKKFFQKSFCYFHFFFFYWHVLVSFVIYFLINQNM